MAKRATWAWAQNRDAEAWLGFDSRAKAEAHGRHAYGSLGFVAPCRWPDPATIAVWVLDADELLERMNEYAAEEFWAEDPLFKLRDKAKAEHALARAIEAWAKRYVRATAFTVDSEKAEPVTP